MHATFSYNVHPHLTAPQFTVSDYIRKSLIAAWLGNLVGALLVAVPAMYFYLSADNALRDVEEGEVLGNSNSGMRDSGSTSLSNSKNWEARTERRVD
jgi:hypothetical protein